MLRKLLAIGLGLSAPVSVWALGLGDIQLNSALNESLVAEIPITASSQDELSGFEARVALHETFERYGLDRPVFLNSLYFTLRQDAAGKPVLQVNSVRPITEPFVTFLLEATWDSGRLLREYTVLLDPPVFNDQAVAAPVNVARSVTAVQNTYSGQVTPTPRPSPVPAPRYRPTAIVGETYGPVQRNQNLWTISKNALPNGVSINQMMVAIYRANPSAFMGNINLLKEGATLQIPNADSVRNLLRTEANGVVVAHNNDWQGGQVSSGGSRVASQTTQGTSQQIDQLDAPRNPRLKLVAPDEVPDGAGSGEALEALKNTRELLSQEQLENAELTGELDSLREELAETKRLLNLENSDLADLQQTLGQDNQTGKTAVANTVTSGTPATNAEVVPDGTDTSITDQQVLAGTDEPSAAVDPTKLLTKPATQVEQPKPAVVVPPAEESPSLFQRLLNLLTSKLFLLGLAAIAGLGSLWVIMRGRDSSEAESWDAIPLDDDSKESNLDLDASLDKLAQESLDTRSGDSGEVEYFEDTGTFKPIDFDAEEGKSASDQSQRVPALDAETGAYPFEDTLAGETGVKLDQADALSEADFHLAYGLYDQAADLISAAVEKEPNRADLRIKLVEIYFMWSNKEEFRKHAQSVKDMLGDSSPGEWEKVSIMGTQLCPGDPLFESNTAISPVISEVVDLQLGDTADPNDVLDFTTEDFSADVFGDDSAQGSDAEIVDLDLGDALFDSDEAPTETADGNVLDFSFDGNTDTSDASQTVATQEDVKGRIEEALAATSGEDTEEMDLDQLGIDLDFGDITSVSEGTSGEFKLGENHDTINQLAASSPSVSDDDFDELFAGLGDIDDDPVTSTDDAVVPVDLESGDKLLDTSELKVEMEELLAAETSGLVDSDETSRGIEMLDPSTVRQTDGDTGSFSAEIRALSDEDVVIGDELAAATSGEPDFGFDGNNDETIMQKTLVVNSEGAPDISPDLDLSDVFADSEEDTVLATTLMQQDQPRDGTAGHTTDTSQETTSMPMLDEDKLNQFGDETGSSDAATFHGVFPDGADEVGVPQDDFSADVFPGADGRTQEIQAMDLDVGETVDDSGEGTTMRVATSNLALPENADLAINEVGTKLDLARAYLDMGDPDGARGILEEVMQEGNDVQQQDARSLLESLNT